MASLCLKLEVQIALEQELMTGSKLVPVDLGCWAMDYGIWAGCECDAGPSAIWLDADPPRRTGLPTSRYGWAMQSIIATAALFASHDMACCHVDCTVHFVIVTDKRRE